MTEGEPAPEALPLGPLWLSVRLEAEIRETVVSFREKHPDIPRGKVAMALLRSFRQMDRDELGSLATVTGTARRRPRTPGSGT